MWYGTYGEEANQSIITDIIEKVNLRWGGLGWGVKKYNSNCKYLIGYRFFFLLIRRDFIGISQVPSPAWAVKNNRMIDRFLPTGVREREKKFGRTYKTRRIILFYYFFLEKVVNINWHALLYFLEPASPLPTSERKTDGRMNDRRYRMKQGSQSIAVEIVRRGE